MRTWTVDDYIREEVRRQGHDLSDPDDGGLRVKWMTSAWEWARGVSEFYHLAYPYSSQIECIGRMVEPDKNKPGFRLYNVRVGTRTCPHPNDVPYMVARLVENAVGLSPLEFYRELETIHPFADGNGRTGKIVIQWIGRTWDAPVFPPADFWGHEITNP